MTHARDCADGLAGEGGLSFLHGDGISRIGGFGRNVPERNWKWSGAIVRISPRATAGRTSGPAAAPPV